MNYELSMYPEQIAIIRLYGELGHHETEKIRAQISKTILQGHVTTLIWNLAGLQFMDSSGIGLILGRMRELSIVGGQIIILNPSSTMQKIFQFSGLAQYIMHADEQAAISHIRGIVHG
ncbi:STAS domain-containing protein [Bacillus ndiopicus]|uniref:STAS domain-containing protein n=1 Tax=Bacillus ndiopicus TaxID=1347368 RepID=UPI0005A7A491|nr:anti-sigma factor antagonist [Bacillus ndiopicus]